MPDLDLNSEDARRIAREFASTLRKAGLHEAAAGFERTAATGHVPTTRDLTAARAVANELQAGGVNVNVAGLLTYDAETIRLQAHRWRVTAENARASAAREAINDAELEANIADAAAMARRAELWGQLGHALHGDGWDAPPPTTKLEAARAGAPMASRGAAPVAGDLGDQVVAIYGSTGDRGPIAVAAPRPSSPAPGDLGDQIVAIYESSRTPNH